MAALARKTSRKRKRQRTEISFAPGFHLPTPKQSRNAVGLSPIPKLFEPGPENVYFTKVPHPTCQDDWLAQYDEEGQSFKNFVRTCPWISGRKVKFVRQNFIPEGRNLKERYPNGKIYIEPLGDFNQSSSDCSPCIDDLADFTQRFYGLPVVILPVVSIKLPESKGGVVMCEKDLSVKAGARKSSRVHLKQLQLNYRWSQGHIQLKVDSIHALLRQHIPEDALCLIGLTMMDLFEDETDLFVAGLAAGNQRVAVFSFARYNPCLSFSTEHWYQIWCSKELDRLEKEKILLQRSCKLLVHEIAHLMGLEHCIWFSCCMNGSGHLSEDFAQPIYLCPVDLHKLQHLCGFDVVDRYRKLLEFFKRHNLTEEAQWCEARLLFVLDEV
ncbi:archaemetzincin-2-like isoform X2 [Montipora foliosa]|uniref:archaemetzincin-2-like isoform X2 n=1 Tax=Montipora foliosa TaxID=591990 RepID=UPI0035F1731A